MFLESCLGDQTMLGEWQSETGKTWRKKNLMFDCFVFFCMSLYTSLYRPWQPPCPSYSHTHKILSIFRTYTKNSPTWWALAL